MGHTFKGGGSNRGNGPDDFKDPVLREERRPKTQAEKDAALKAQADEDLRKFTESQGHFVDIMRRGFQSSSELAAARQQRGVQSNVNQFTQRRGLEGGIAADIAGNAQAQLAGQVAQAQLDFDTQINQLLHQERAAFVQGQFDFFNRMRFLERQGEIQKDLLRFQMNLQRDQQAFDMWNNALSLGGQLAVTWLFPPAGAAIIANKVIDNVGTTYDPRNDIG